MLETFIRLNSSRTGHDKLLRTVQYSCRLILASGHKPPQLSHLVTTISFARKFLRLGTCVDALYSSCSSITNPDPALRVLVTLSRISGAMYLLYVCPSQSKSSLNHPSQLWSSPVVPQHAVGLHQPEGLGQHFWEMLALLHHPQSCQRSLRAKPDSPKFCLQAAEGHKFRKFPCSQSFKSYPGYCEEHGRHFPTSCSTR